MNNTNRDYWAYEPEKPEDKCDYGTPRHSGRYPWGSGDNPYQRYETFLGNYHDLKEKGYSQVEIAKRMGMNTRELRAKISIADEEAKKARIAMAIKLKEKGYSNVAIGKRMGGIRESTIRSYLSQYEKHKYNATNATAEVLKEAVDKYGYVDVGKSIEQYLGVSETRMKTALSLLKEQGYEYVNVRVPQATTNNFTTVRTLMKTEGRTKDELYKDAYRHMNDIKLPKYYTEDGGENWVSTADDKIEKPASMSSSRIKVIYAEDGGKEKDGLIEIRRGLSDLNIGENNYAQVRIAVDGTHYMKGMCVYRDDLPDGVDVLYNSNKKRGSDKDTVFKKLEWQEGSNNPFGAEIRRQYKYEDANGEQKLGVVNIVNEEGNWSDWSKTLSKQFLSKQPTPLIKKQLNLAYDTRAEEFEEILSLTNPAVKKKLLIEFADDCDSAASHLKAASLPRQQTHAILPIPEMKDNEIYAPNYKDGETVVLVRFPHGGKFEIPELVVNNHNSAARKIMGTNPKDAVGININVANKLSGADFDGDTVLVIPNNNHEVKTMPSLKGLENFDTNIYADPTIKTKEERKKNMSDRTKGIQMGLVSNLITDMTIKGAPPDELERAVRHSMVIIDAQKHGLNWKQSALDNRISELYMRYQGKPTGGASTLISQSGATTRVPYRTEDKFHPDPETGERNYVYKEKYYDKLIRDKDTHQVIGTKKTPKTVEVTKMSLHKDAHELSSGYEQDEIYADYANKLKAMANAARKEWLSTPNQKRDPSAAKAYAPEVQQLVGMLNIAKKNDPLERQAQLLANRLFKIRKQDHPEMEADDVKKMKGRLLKEARLRVGAKKERVTITPRQWEAIQAGAISQNVLDSILQNADMDKIKEYSMPRKNMVMSDARIARARSMAAQGRTTAEIAEMLDVSASTIQKVL